MTVHFSDGSSIDRGSIIQVKQTLYSGTWSTNSNNWQNTSLSIAITPTSANSRVIIMGHAILGTDQHGEGFYRINGGNGNWATHYGNAAGSRTQCMGFMGNDWGHGATADGWAFHTSFIVMGHPNSTSTQTMYFSMKSRGSDYVYLGRDAEDPNNSEGGRPVSGMIAMEVSDGAFTS